MLERIDYIRKVGLFNEYIHSSGHDIGDLTIIYGENGVGKSTLAAIFDSLRESNSAEIARRRSLPGDISPSVAITVNSIIYKFEGGKWINELPHDHLEIFYPGFVTRNIYTAISVESDHRRNLCELVLGRKAVEKINRLAEVDNESRATLAELKKVEQELQLLIKGAISIDAFKELPHDTRIEENIIRSQKELQDANNKTAILERAIPEPVILAKIDKEFLASILERSEASIGNNSGEIVRKHIDNRLDDKGEKWISYGVKYLATTSICPFCDQDTTTSNLTNAIKQYFSDNYREYIKKLSVDIDNLRTQFSLLTISRIKSSIASQFAIASQWTDGAPIDQTETEQLLSKAEKNWVSATNKLDSILNLKQSKPLDYHDSTLGDDAVAEFSSSLDDLEEINRTLVTYRSTALDKKNALQKTDSTQIKKLIEHFENQKIRFEPLAKSLLEKRSQLTDKRLALNEEKTRLKDEIEQNAERVVSKYQTGINYYLEHFGCEIRIESIKTQFPSGKASVNYKLKVRGHDIPLGFSEDAPCFESVLSEGDKYTLALSFFFARLKEFVCLKGRTVILDDPVNSLGSSRRTFINGIIRDLKKRNAQVVVLTHDERLAAMLFRDKKLKNITALQVQRTNNGSKLVEWDVEVATRTKYVEHYITLNNFLENGGDHKPAANCIRLYLEQRLRHMFPGPPFQVHDSLGQMVGKIRDSAAASRIYSLKSKLTELEAINDASLPDHHATDDVPGMDVLSAQEVRIFAKKALQVLE